MSNGETGAHPKPLADGLLRFTPLTITGASSGRIGDEAARVVRCQLIDADLAADWAVRIKVRDA